MEKESMKNLLAAKNKFNYRQLFMITVLVFITAADVLIDYVTAGFDPSIFKDASYWITLLITCISIVFVVLTVRDFFREKEIRENTAIADTQRLIDSAHSELIKRDLTTRFEEYVNGINAARKLKAYKEYIQYKLLKCKNEKRRAEWQKRLDNATTDIEYLPTRGNKITISTFRHVKFAKVRVATIFSRVDRAKGEDENLETNEQKHVGELIGKKVAMVMAFSIAFSTLFFNPGTFAVAKLVNTFTKLFRTAISIFLGATDGQEFARGALLSKMKLRLDFIQKFLESEKAKLATNTIEETAKAVE